MKSVLVPLADGFEEIEALAVVDILRRGGVRVVTASLDEEPAVRAAHGVTVLADAPLVGVVGDSYDAIILPGGGEGTANLRASSSLAERLRRQKAGGGLVCAICAAPTVLEAAGVLKDEKVTCYPGCEDGLARPRVEASVVEDGNVITGRAPGSAVAFALAVLKRLCGNEAALQVAAGLVTEEKL